MAHLLGGGGIWGEGSGPRNVSTIESILGETMTNPSHTSVLESNVEVFFKRRGRRRTSPRGLEERLIVNKYVLFSPINKIKSLKNCTSVF